MTRKTLFLIPLLLSLTSAPLHAESGSGNDFVDGKSNYIAVEPTVVNIREGRRMRFMQVKTQLMTRNAQMASLVQANMPAVRHTLLMLFSAQQPETMRDVHSREALRGEALAHLQQLFYDLFEVGTPPGKTGAEENHKPRAKIGEDGEVKPPMHIEAVYFTDFIIQ